ncbi:two-component system sensor histidine kinase YesM [Neobacillus niacini]|uniref:sensor histidine kinase n=1 Tax=Neobacillus niacini TaxID=86668 RepID=UPI0028549745|nr:sensor histidine kinase [Neobacillus niacini]MDR7078466.1 two-component system sensor histidine kinase YesM [Neobacillus niacini]
MKFWFLRLNLFQRLLIYFSLIIISSLVLVTVTTYIKASSTIENQVSVYLEQIVNNVNLQIDEYLKNYELATLPLITSQEVRKFLDRGAISGYESFVEYSEIRDSMDGVITERPEIEQIYLMGETGRYIMSNEPRGTFPVAEFYQDLNERTPNDGKILIYPRINQNKLVITMARKIRGTKTFEPKGIIAVDLKPSYLTRSWGEIKLDENSFFMIVGDDGQIIYHPDDEYMGKEIKQSIKNRLANKSENNFYEKWKDEKFFFHFNTSSYTGWKVVLAVPRVTLFEPISVVRTTVYISGAIAIILALFLAQHFIRKIVTPIRMIERTMKNVEKGNWELAPEPSGNDEISSLVQNYNKMVKRLASLIDQVYKAELENQKGQIMLQKRELEKQKVEFQALQSQINPHFLYNTLGAINSYAILKEDDEISEMTEALANMFRYSLQNLEVVKIEDELLHVKDFLLIQEHRWQKKIPFSTEIDSQLLQAEIVKLSLQPLVENAIEHGFQPVTDESKITIRGKVKGDILFLSVEDNGIGMNHSRLLELRNKLKNEQLHLNTDHGIGLSNVAKRTKLLFGNDYGIEIFSEHNKGTTIRMAVPYRLKG